MKTKPKRGSILTLDIHALAFGGKGISRLKNEDGTPGYVVFVPNTIPGQKVLTRIIKSRNRHAEGKLLDILDKSPDEVEIPYQSIPGAPYATWPLEKQELEKKQGTFELFKRIGNVQEPESIFDEFISSPRAWHYRNKMEYSFSAVGFDIENKKEFDGFALGFKHRGQWLSVENMDKDSGLFDADIEDKLKQIRTWCENTGLLPWHAARHSGFFRYLTFRKSFKDQRFLCNLTTTSPNGDEFDAQAFVDLIRSLFGQRVAGIWHTLNDETGDRNMSQNTDQRLLFGQVIIQDILLDLEFDVSLQSFFQPNPSAASLLYSKAVDYALLNRTPNKEDVIMDLFCGTGTIGQILAQRCGGTQNIIGVDIVDEAIENAKQNAIKNKLEGLEFFAADVGRFLKEFPQYQNKIHTIILDPPRGGIAPKTLKRIIDLGAKRIVYVSCNPATQARDTIDLYQAGYQLKKLSMVDQFPHTAHIETVALFEK